MIHLITANPGSGKTLYTLDYYTKFAEKENRQVYYYGIPLTPEGENITGWIPLDDPRKWHELPAGAIIIIDEAQDIYPMRKVGSVVPEHVGLFNKHRHYGVDIVLITQHPGLIDSHIRRVVGRHTHIVRIFGSHASTILNWDGLQENPNVQAAKKGCVDSHKFIYPKKVFSWYKSSELHTHKFKLPRKVYTLLALVVFVLIAMIIAAYILLGMSGEAPTETVPTSTGQTSQPATEQRALGDTEKKTLTPEEYIEQRQIRVAGMPHSAPVYDDLSKPRTFPRLSACVQMGDACRCYTQQGTEIKGIPPRSCEQYVAHGWFDDWKEDHLSERGPLADRERVPPPVQISPPVIEQPSNRIVTIGAYRIEDQSEREEGKS